MARFLLVQQGDQAVTDFLVNVDNITCIIPVPSSNKCKVFFIDKDDEITINGTLTELITKISNL